MTSSDDSDIFLYVVRCNFTDPAREAGWNSFYKDQHGPALLAMPGFCALTRYEAVGLDTSIKHMAVWEIDSPKVFESDEYRGHGGGQWPEKWRPYVTDWTRSVFKKTTHLKSASE